MTLSRRAVFGLMAAAPGIALAQGFPAQPVRLVVPFPPGGPADLIGRLIARVMGERLGKAVVVENRSGAGGLVGIEAVARAAPDGHVIGLASSGVLAVQPHLTQQMPFDPQTELAPIGLVLSVPQILAVHPSVPANTVAELVALAKAQPGRLSYGSAGIGSSLHMAGELFKQRAGIDIVHVPYRGAAPAVTDALAGRIQILMADVPALLSHVRSGALRGLGVTSARRIEQLPDLPTMVEAGVPGMLSETFYGLVSAAGTPPERIALLHAAMVAALDDAETRAALASQGGMIVASTPQAFASAVVEGAARWGEVVRAGNIRLE
ncbi:tripartite tricarboxylate transporter substrate binding protein [Roseomonas eburnea]|uniref:Tripartite tricarboxylate transporter substrate binding protein n=1 Tax=Neoroseomonas eburnea TaxID=1346889 RepID=A0A9X9XC98_9PROT|nr:tripartite tricarboxylate transporter substrate binding protein [Neoroseomonas eburnea]MBR0681334.1 tripartite tricarboxylate transporter substrate binding protein [Neoroseomonas eburnea]